MQNMTLRIDWKSDKYRDFQHNISKITPAMAKCLADMLLSDTQNFNSRTVSALQWRELLDENRNLTDHGRTLGLTKVPLSTQCEILQLPLEEWRVPSISNPEDTVLKTLSEMGSTAYFVENSFGLFIDYLMGKALINAAKELNKTIYTLNPTYDLELFFRVKETLEEYISRLDIDHCETSYRICSPYLTYQVPGNALREIVIKFGQIYRAFGIPKIGSVLRFYFTNPLAYNYRGWPDIVVADPNNPHCIEVKTTDKLHLNQIVTIPDLVHQGNVPTKIIRLNPIRSQIG